MDNASIVLNGVTYYHYDEYQKQVRAADQLRTTVIQLEGIIDNLKTGNGLTRYYIHSEPHLHQYSYYSIDAKNITEARDKYFRYLDSTVGEIYPTQDVVDTEKRNSNITDRAMTGSEYLHIE